MLQTIRRKPRCLPWLKGELNGGQKPASNGFTLIEILVVIGILVVLSSLGLLVSLDFYRSYAFNSERDLVVAALQKARSQSLSNINQSAHGLKIISSGRYVIFEGDAYSSGSASNLDLPADPSITASGSGEIVFEQISGRAIGGQKLITLSDPKGRSAQITINPEGGIEW